MTHIVLTLSIQVRQSFNLQIIELRRGLFIYDLAWPIVHLLFASVPIIVQNISFLINGSLIRLLNYHSPLLYIFHRICLICFDFLQITLRLFADGSHQHFVFTDLYWTFHIWTSAKRSYI